MKKALSILCILAAVISAAALFVTRNTSPSHPTLAQAELPKLIPTRTFYADPRSAYDYIVSSDASMMVHVQASLTGRSLVVQNRKTGEEITTIPIGPSHLRWHPTKPLLRFVFERDDWEMDPYAPERQNWNRITPVKLSGGWFKNEIANSATDQIMTWGKKDNRGVGKMWLISQDGLEATEIANGIATSKYWVFDDDYTPVLRLDSLDPATERMMRFENGEWTQLIDISLNDAFNALSNVRKDGTMLARSARGRDKAALVSFDTRTGKETVILSNPDADIAWTSNLDLDKNPDFIRMGFNTLDRKALTPKGEVFLDVLDQFPQPVTLGKTSPVAGGRYVVQALSPRNQSFINILVDLESGSYETLGEFHFRRFKEDLVADQPVTFTARDGKEIHALLNMPENIDGPIPFVVYIHGGPAGVREMGYGHGTQFLVNRGYGVLAVNFRGSTGFGKAYQAAGFNEFGRAMQDDITDAAHWLVNEGLADTDALAVMGASYGGYSSALAMSRDPGLFDAAIVEFPMLDVEFQSKYHPGFWDDGLYGWWRYFGQVDNPDELALMKEHSPSSQIDNLHGPILLLAGVRDQITAVQQARDYAKEAQDAGKNVDAHYFENAGHGVNHWRDELRRGRLIEDFLSQHLGGRSGGLEFVEYAPEFID